MTIKLILGHQAIGLPIHPKNPGSVQFFETNITQTSAPLKTRRGGDDSKQDEHLVEITERNMTDFDADQIKLAPTEYRR